MGNIYSPSFVGTHSPGFLKGSEKFNNQLSFQLALKLQLMWFYSLKLIQNKLSLSCFKSGVSHHNGVTHEGPMPTHISSFAHLFYFCSSPTSAHSEHWFFVLPLQVPDNLSVFFLSDYPSSSFKLPLLLSHIPFLSGIVCDSAFNVCFF